MSEQTYTFQELNPYFPSIIDQDAIITLSGDWVYESTLKSGQLDMVLEPNPYMFGPYIPAASPSLKETIQSKLHNHGYVIVNNAPCLDKSAYEDNVEPLVDFLMKINQIEEQIAETRLSRRDEQRLRNKIRQDFAKENSALNQKIKHEKNILRVVVNCIGHSVVFEGEGNDDMGDVSVIKPSRAIVSGETSFKTSNEFFPHTDMSYADNPPDFMTLYIGQTDQLRRAQSVFSSVDAAVKLLEPETITELLKEQFNFKLPNRANQRDQSSFVQGAVLKDIGNGHYHVRFRRDTLSAQNNTATEALDKLKQAFGAVSFGYVAQPGTIMIVDNRRVLHGRSPFIASHDDDDRYVLRAYASAEEYRAP